MVLFRTLCGTHGTRVPCFLAELEQMCVNRKVLMQEIE